jgi:hydrogenase expression/formation protein HypC
MCIGLPMTIVSSNETNAECERRGQTHDISLLLIGEQPPGTKILVHLETAIRVLEDEEAQLIDDALDGLAAAIDGQSFDHLFADLIDREPQLPEHLRAKQAQVEIN